MHKSWLSWKSAGRFRKSLSAPVLRALKFHHMAQTRRELGKPIWSLVFTLHSFRVTSSPKSRRKPFLFDLAQDDLCFFSTTKVHAFYLKCVLVYLGGEKGLWLLLDSSAVPKAHPHVCIILFVVHLKAENEMVTMLSLFILWLRWGLTEAMGMTRVSILLPLSNLKPTAIAPHSMRPVFIPTGH